LRPYGDRTFALYDLATALERNAVPWLQMDSDGHARADLDIVDALLEVYHQVGPLSAQSVRALTAWLPASQLPIAARTQPARPAKCLPKSMNC
jgi:Ser/Thr protein kinase RdoA (MazF antagonist)